MYLCVRPQEKNLDLEKQKKKSLASSYRTRCFSPEVNALTDSRLSASQIISEEANQGVDYEYFLPHANSRDGYYWSFGSWSACSRECGSGQSQ